MLLSLASTAQVTLEGFVTDRVEQGNGIAQAKVRYVSGGDSTVTDATGHFVLTLPQLDSYEIAVTHPDFERLTQVVFRTTPLIRIESKFVLVRKVVPIIQEVILLPELIVDATRASKNMPMTFSSMDAKQIAKINLGQDMPYLLRFTPSLVATSDAGNGIGYTGLWIRGSDPSRINVTINGVPINDAESQQLYWVDMPDMGSTTSSVQVQRGVGSSTNGNASFGGNIAVQTDQMRTIPSFESNNSIGSFGTVKNNLVFSNGLINDHWTMNGRLSRIHSDGYIDRAKSDLKSYYFSAGYLGEKTQLKLTVFGGFEETYQAWNGSPIERFKNMGDSAIKEYAGRNGLYEDELANLLKSGRTYNSFTYKNQVDHYNQDHVQAVVRRNLKDYLVFNLTGHYTFGRGYYEEYKRDQSFGRYGLTSPYSANYNLFSDGVDGDGYFTNSAFSNLYTSDYDLSFTPQLGSNNDTIYDVSGNALLNANSTLARTDIVRRRWLSNRFYGLVGSLVYNKPGSKWEGALGFALNQYSGKHFGELIWLEHAESLGNNGHYYDGKSLKTDGNVYAKATCFITKKLSAYGDLQMRKVMYSTSGKDNDLVNYNVKDNLLFFNPKAGLMYQLNTSTRFYASAAVGNHEPNRNDYIDAPVGKTPKSEYMTDIEAGFSIRRTDYSFGANIYDMIYKNQLVLTGALNDVGTPLRTNVASSFRRGLEVEGGVYLGTHINVAGNITLSQNQIKQFDEVIYDYTIDYEEKHISHSNTAISFSPSMIAASILSFSFNTKGGVVKSWRQRAQSERNPLELAFSTKYVGKQYLDNTQNEALTIDAYAVSDLRLSYSIWTKSRCMITLNAMMNNAFDRVYASNGYTYGYIYGSRIDERFYFPQAGRNFLIGVGVKF